MNWVKIWLFFIDCKLNVKLCIPMYVGKKELNWAMNFQAQAKLENIVSNRKRSIQNKNRQNKTLWYRILLSRGNTWIRWSIALDILQLKKRSMGCMQPTQDLGPLKGSTSNGHCAAPLFFLSSYTNFHSILRKHQTHCVITAVLTIEIDILSNLFMCGPVSPMVLLT
jgi:hypothetical protein